MNGPCRSSCVVLVLPNMRASLIAAFILVALSVYCASAEVQGRAKRNILDLFYPFPPTYKKEEQHINFRLYTRETLNNPEIVDSRNVTEFKRLKPDKPTKVIIHGWRGYGDCVFSTHVRNAFLPLLDINVIAVDWSAHGSKAYLYPSARNEVPEVGRLVAEFLDFLAEKQELKLPEIHVLGHSLGGQIAGVSGKLLKNGKIGRITGLDPAGPMFSVTDVSGRLSNESAQFVDVIHTTASFLGFKDPLGHVDFYPNGGQAIQPGCGFDVIGKCSHRRSYEFYLETIKNPNSCPAVACDDWKSFMRNNCENNNIEYMGEAASKTARGKYYFQTSKEVPYFRDFAGTFYSEIEEPALQSNSDINDDSFV